LVVLLRVLLGKRCLSEDHQRILTDITCRWRFQTLSPPWLKQGITLGHTPDPVLARGCKIHGLVGKLPAGYGLAYVPLDAEVRPFTDATQAGAYKVASNYNVAKALLSIFQTCYAAVTIYKARGDQITVFGYAAFGLTVLPYLVMSLVNLIAQVVTADYDTFFIVHSPELDEAKRRGFVVEGITGTLVSEDSTKNTSAASVNEIWKVTHKTKQRITIERQSKDRQILPGASLQFSNHRENNAGLGSHVVHFPFCTRFKRTLGPTTSGTPSERFKENRTASAMRATMSLSITIYAPLVFVAIMLATVGGLTRFHAGSSTQLERGFILSWILIGGLMGGIWSFISELSILVVEADSFGENICQLLIWGPLFGGFFVPAIGGLVVVGKELVQFGICSRIG
jgi:hypothetical protein